MVACDLCPIGKYQNKDGSFYCAELKANQLLQPVEKANGATEMMPWSCRIGMTCTDDSRSYDGGVWHDPKNAFPTQQEIYTWYCAHSMCIVVSLIDVCVWRLSV